MGELRFSVCVIDPRSGATGVRTVQAIYLVDAGDTVVVQGANRVALRTTTGNVVVAPEASLSASACAFAMSSRVSRWSSSTTPMCARSS